MNDKYSVFVDSVFVKTCDELVIHRTIITMIITTISMLTTLMKKRLKEKGH